MAEHRFEQENRDIQKSLQDAQAASTDTYKAGIDLLRKGVERNIAIQKQVLDAAAQQNAESANVWKKVYGCFPGAESIVTLTEKVVENAINLPRKYLDIMEEQSNEIAGSAKSQADRTERTAQETTDENRAQWERQKSA